MVLSKFLRSGAAAARSAAVRRFQPTLQRLQSRPMSESLSNAAQGAETYARSLQWFHWGMAGGILASFGTVYAAESKEMPAGAKAFLMRWHSSIGMLVLGALGGRVFLRLSTKIPAHLAGAWWEVLGARAAHAAMYPMMAVLPLTGIAMSYYGGGGIPFFGVTIPGKGEPKEPDMAFAKSQAEWHGASCDMFSLVCSMTEYSTYFNTKYNDYIFQRRSATFLRSLCRSTSAPRGTT